MTLDTEHRSEGMFANANDGVEGGQRKPYRDVPRDFIARWPAVGWSAAKEEWHAHSRTIERWIDECGRDMMVLARKAWLDEQRSRRKRYVMGRTMTPIGRSNPD